MGRTVNRYFTTSDARVHLLNGWVLSLALHSLLLFAAISLFRQSPITLPTEPFRWEVALLESIPTTHDPSQSTSPAEPAISRNTTQARIPAQPHRTTRQIVAPTEQIVPLEQQTAATVEPARPTNMLSSTEPLREPTPASMAHESPSALAQASESPQPQTELPSRSMAQEPTKPETVAVSSSGSTASMSDSAQQLHQPTATDTAAPPSTNRPDYGWLQRAIFQRLDELKRSSRPSLDQAQPLKVLVRAVVSREGTLLNAEIVKSSGLDRIDQEAMALVQRVFPMAFDRPLDRQQVAMRIPITYSRD